MDKVEYLAEALKGIHGSRFKPLTDEQIANIESEYSKFPADLKKLYKILGYGCIGDSLYMVHCPGKPSAIYDNETSSQLKGLLIVGDDFMGNCEAYDPKNNWAFGTIMTGGKFETMSNATGGFVDFLYNWVENNK